MSAPPKARDRDWGRIRAGDVLISIDGELVTGKSNAEIRTWLAGKYRTGVTFEFERDGATIEITVGRFDEFNPFAPM